MHVHLLGKTSHVLHAIVWEAQAACVAVVVSLAIENGAVQCCITHASLVPKTGCGVVDLQRMPSLSVCTCTGYR